MSFLPLREPDDDLLPVIRSASSDDLGVLVEYIHKVYNEDLSSIPAFKEQNPRADEKIYDGDHRLYADDIAAEIQRYGGNSFSNVFRGGKGVAYIDVVRDVADQLKVSYNNNASAAMIENQIQMKVLEKAYAEMSETERAELLNGLGVNIIGAIPASLPVIAVQGAILTSGFAAYRLAVIVANAIAKALLGKGLTIAGNAALTRVIGAFAGPIGWAITGLWTLVDLAGPAYRVTIPCVVQLAYMRQKMVTAQCSKCGEQQSANSKFCSSCGSPMSQ